jgi:hypothetical protein
MKMEASDEPIPAPPPEKQQERPEIPTPDRRAPQQQPIERELPRMNVTSADYRNEKLWRARRQALDKKRKQYQIAKRKKVVEKRVSPVTEEEGSSTTKKVAVAGLLASVAGLSAYMFTK